MKYLILIGVIFAVIWWLKLSRDAPSKETKASSDQPQSMVACLHCGLHLPQNDALATRNGFYCSEEHRALKEG